VLGDAFEGQAGDTQQVLHGVTVFGLCAPDQLSVGMGTLHQSTVRGSRSFEKPPARA
jgi:hypothetical protein